MKKYVFFCFSTRIGGGQRYVDYKVSYLLRRCWNPIVFTAYEKAVDDTKIMWNNIDGLDHHLNEYIFKAPEFWSKTIVERVLAWMECVIDKKDGDEVIIESHTSYFAEWGEMLAKRIHARHFCYIIDEIYNSYGANDLLFFKFGRGELAVIRGEYINTLLQKHTTVTDSEKYKLVAAGGNHAQDVNTDIDTHADQFDINILYFGRYKQYCEEIKKSVKEFALNHPDKKIQFIIIGEIRNLQDLRGIENICVYQVGFLNPVPKKVFIGIDVAISGAGSARICAEEGVPTIVANPTTFLATGILGYTVFDTLADENSVKYEDLLEDILFNSVLDGKKAANCNDEDADSELDKHFVFLSKADPKLVYYNFTENPQRNYSIRSKVGYYMRKYTMPLYRLIIKNQRGNPFKKQNDR